MKTRTLILFEMIIISCILISCESDIDDNTDNISIEFYNAVPKDKSWDEYIISEEPLITEDDIEYYDWDNHRIVFKKEFYKGKEIEDTLKYPRVGSEIFDTRSTDKFLVYIDNQLIYEGFYNQSPASSFFAIGAVMIDLEDGIRIDFKGVEDTELEDKRSDKRIYEALKDNKILKE